ncbi:hypothetical protein [Streptomyces sp. NPDC007205]|uniref:hypothetical protein n=1 Tax=Streptomyces sp. NPDC007205 TaxID=3154316 RepID=UPI0033E8350A
MSRKRIALAAAGLALAGGLAAAPAAANKCSGWKEIHITGGAAKYMECTKKVNGKGVQAYAETDYNDWYGDDVTWQHFYSWADGTHHSPEIISGWHPGNDFGLVIELK